jgi:hypothetical protein
MLWGWRRWCWGWRARRWEFACAGMCTARSWVAAVCCLRSAPCAVGRASRASKIARSPRPCQSSPHCSLQGDRVVPHCVALASRRCSVQMVKHDQTRFFSPPLAGLHLRHYCAPRRLPSSARLYLLLSALASTRRLLGLVHPPPPRCTFPGRNSFSSCWRCQLATPTCSSLAEARGGPWPTPRRSPAQTYSCVPSTDLHGRQPHPAAGWRQCLALVDLFAPTSTSTANTCSGASYPPTDNAAHHLLCTLRLSLCQ